MDTQGLPINYFDLIALVVVVVGILRGRKRGMSQELLDFFMWIGIVFASAYAWQPGGDLIRQKIPDISLVMARVLAYLTAVLGCFIIKSIIANWVKDRITGSDFFKALEYPLGMLAGGVRFLCILLMFMSLINACESTAKERADLAKIQKENFGSISFPTLGEIQNTVFTVSLTGKFVRDKVDPVVPVLVKRGPVLEKPSAPRDTLKDKKQKEMDTLMGR